jgi:hypothetical protein
MTQRYHAFNTGSVIEQKVEARGSGSNEVINVDTATGKFGDRVAKHRRLCNRRLSIAFPKLRVM